MVDSANYGRYEGADVCPHPTVSVSLPPSNRECVLKFKIFSFQSDEYACEAESSLVEVKNRCDGENSCQVPATNAVFGDPCRGTYKYLEVAYNCQ